jgi:hypothetical protein
MRNGAVIGAAVGAGVAIVLTILDSVRPFPWQSNGVVERLTFRLCPLYILGFADGMGSMTNVVIVTVIGNAILYGTAFGALAVVVSLFKHHTA